MALYDFPPEGDGKKTPYKVGFCIGISPFHVQGLPLNNYTVVYFSFTAH